jgi:polar amino acid transport system substrate-binding protein
MIFKTFFLKSEKINFRVVFTILAIAFLGSVFSQPSEKQELCIGMRSSPPFVIIEGDSYSGLSLDLWEEIAGNMGYSYYYKPYNDLGNLLEAIELGEVDLSINPLTVTSDRLTRFSFTQPYFISGMAIAVRTHVPNHILLVLRNLISGEFLTVVFLLFLVIFVFGFIIWFIERDKNSVQFEKGLKGLGHGLWWSAVTMTTVGYGDKSPTTAAGRIISVIWMFTAVIIISSFTASISASLTYNQITLNIRGLSDLKHATVGTVKNSSTSEFLSEMGIKHIKYETLEEALDELTTSQITALVYDEPLLSYLIQQRKLSDKLELIPSGLNSVYFGFASANIRFIEEINPELLEIIESREWFKMLKNYNLRSK